MSDGSDVSVPSSSSEGELLPVADGSNSALTSEPNVRKELRKICKNLRHACESLAEGKSVLEEVTTYGASYILNMTV